MPEYRQYYSTRQILDVNEFLSKTGTYYLMCVSAAQLYALRKMAKTRLLWPTTWAKEKYEQSYMLPEASDWDVIDTHISEWIAETEKIEMCNTALLTALNAIADNIRLSSCCYESGPGLVQIGDDMYYGSEQPLSEPTSFGEGEEFATEGDYESHRCQVANGIVNGLIGSLNGLSVLTLGGLVASAVLAAIVGFGLIFVPPVAVIATLAVTGLTLGALYSLANEIEENKTAIVCAIYNSTTAQEAYDIMDSFIRDLSVDLGFLELQVGALADLVMQMCPIDTFNKLYRNVGLPEIGGDEVDCDSECDVCPEVFVTWGSYDEQTNYVVAEWRETHSMYYVEMAFNATALAIFCGSSITLDITEISGSPNAPGPNYGYRFFNQAGAIVYYSISAPPGDPVDNVGSITLRAEDPFTVELFIT